MILQKKTETNGYGCSCCGADWDYTDWIKEKEAISEDDLFQIARKSHPYDSGKYDFGGWSNISHFSYEKDGKRLYGFDITFGRALHHVTFFHSDGTKSKDIQEEWNVEREKLIEKAKKAEKKRAKKKQDKADVVEYERLKKKFE